MRRTLQANKSECLQALPCPAIDLISMSLSFPNLKRISRAVLKLTNKANNGTPVPGTVLSASLIITTIILIITRGIGTVASAAEGK